MNKTKEIEEKFDNHQLLIQEDINTPLLKSRYKHINHLDLQSNKVTADVASLKIAFKLLEQKVYQRFEYRFETFEQNIEATI